MMNSPVFNLETDLFLYIVLTFRITVIHCASDHALDDPVFTEIVHAFYKRFNGRAITDNRGLISTVDDLIQFMSDDDGGESLLFEFHQQIQQHLGVLIIQRRCRLI